MSLYFLPGATLTPALSRQRERAKAGLRLDLGKSQFSRAKALDPGVRRDDGNG